MIKFLNRTFKHVGDAITNPSYATGVKFTIYDNLDGALSVEETLINSLSPLLKKKGK